MQTHTRPALAVVFSALGWIGVIAAALLIVSGVANSAPPVLYVGVGCFISSLIYFGISGILNASSRAAFYSEEGAKLAERQSMGANTGGKYRGMPD